jgi:hypothetical protein
MSLFEVPATTGVVCLVIISDLVLGEVLDSLSAGKLSILRKVY